MLPTARQHSFPVPGNLSHVDVGVALLAVAVVTLLAVTGDVMDPYGYVEDMEVDYSPEDNMELEQEQEDADADSEEEDDGETEEVSGCRNRVSDVLKALT